LPDSTKPPHSKRPLLVGLTGGIASGKSLVANLFAAQGVTIIDADLIARRLVEPGTPGLMAIIDHFGTALLNDQGALNRERIAQLIFSNSQSRQQLEAILHPLILQQMQQDIAAASEAPYLLVVIPLLQETGQHRLMDRVLLVDCPVEEQHRRLMQRNQISPSQAQAMIAAQASREERIAIANDTLRNSCPQDRDRLPRLVAELHQRYLQLAMGP
jgi:dephospho-CoA kinase